MDLMLNERLGSTQRRSTSHAAKDDSKVGALCIMIYGNKLI